MRLAIFAEALLLLLMLGWSMNLFRIRGIQLSLHFSFFLLVALAAETGWLEGEWTGMWFSVATLLAFFTCVVLHELGHSFTAMRFGIGVRRILLLPIGGMAEFEEIPRRPLHELLITIAGPAVNFAIAALLALAFGLPDVDQVADGMVTVDLAGFAHLLLVWNLLMGCFNLLPVFPMDGGRILRALLACRLNYVRATFIAATIGKVLAVVAAGIALYFFKAGLTAVLFAFIFLVGEMEYRMAKRRAAEEAHWRETLARMSLPSEARTALPA
jgi:Zn-dependent protease